MNKRIKCQEEIAYKYFCEKLAKTFLEAIGSGVKLDDLLFYAYGFVTSRMSSDLLVEAMTGKRGAA